jgi:hypothetical protein
VDGVQDQGSEDTTTINVDGDNPGGLLDITDVNAFRLGNNLYCRRIMTSRILASRLMEFYCSMFCGNLGYQPNNYMFSVLSYNL